MATQTEAAQKITAAFYEAEKRILPARLANVPSNHLSVMAYISAKALDPSSPDSYITTFKAVMHQLEWIVKPAQLVVQESAGKPAAAENQLKIEEDRATKVKAAEQKEKIEKEIAELVEQCEDLIASYHPHKKTGALDYLEQADAQKKWKATLEDAKKQNNLSRMKSYRDSLVATVNKRYQEQEKASERM